MQQCASKSSHGFFTFARRYNLLHRPQILIPIGFSSSSSSIAPLHFIALLSRNPPSFPRLFCSAIDSVSPSSPSSHTSSNEVSNESLKFSTPAIRPRMPAVPEPRPKPTTAVAVVEEYLDKLWRDFFTNPHNWFDNRLKRRAPKYADFKNKLTKEGLWITARWNPLWVRTELSLMTNFRAVPYDDPLWEEKRRLEEEEKKEKPPPVAPGAWLREELKLKQAKAAGIEPGDPNLTTPSAPSPSQDK